MNDNTKQSSPILMDAILKAKTDQEKQRACSLVLAALEDRDTQINEYSNLYRKTAAIYNGLLDKLDQIKSRQKIEL